MSCTFYRRFDKNNCQYHEHYRGIPEHYWAFIWEFDNSIIGKNFSIIYKPQLTTLPCSHTFFSPASRSINRCIYNNYNFSKNVFACHFCCFLSTKLFLHNYNVMTRVRCRRGKSIIILKCLLLFAERLPNCQHSHKKRRVRTDQSNTKKNRVYVRTRTAAVFCHVNQHVQKTKQTQCGHCS